MKTVLRDYCQRKIIDDFDIREDDSNNRTIVSVWMDGTSYDDQIVQQVRRDLTLAAKAQERPALIVIGAIIERLVVSSDRSRTLHHQRVRPVEG